MCGIVGILGQDPVVGRLLESLKRLEYRGYDSAGMAILERGELIVHRVEGKLCNLEKKLHNIVLKGQSGIGHTRWATHGRPSENNAHPHQVGNLALVHNGIIENFRQLRQELQAKGHVFSSETDTEVIAHLVSAYLREGYPPLSAVQAVLPHLKGAFALAFLFKEEEDLLIGACKGAPLAVAASEGEAYLGSDALALAPLSDQITYLEDGDLVVLRRQGIEIFSDSGKRLSRPQHQNSAGKFFIDKGHYPYFMAKEIHEQPEVVGRTLAHYIDMLKETVVLPSALPFDLAHVSHLTIVGCGTALMAGMVAKYWLERFAGIRVECDIASEFRYRDLALRPGHVLLVISQSGETADTLACLRYARQKGQLVVAIVNALPSTIAREADVVLPTLAGPEIGVASTKAFTCQLAVLACFSLVLGRARGHLCESEERELLKSLLAIPGLLAEVLKIEPQIEALAQELKGVRNILYLGRATAYPLALEGALKLKELSYIHAEGYAAGELKHGPIALIDSQMRVVVLAPRDHVFEKTLSNLQEVNARGGKIILIGDSAAIQEIGVEKMVCIGVPEMASEFSPLVYAVPLQLLAYHVALAMGKDADQPRNLAKSVTVE